MEYVREKKGSKPILAICYDFDKTLSPDDMQAQGFIQDVYGDNISEFWAEVDELGIKNDMDSNLAYMFKMKQLSYGKLIFNRSTLEDYGSRVKLFPGVDTWFDRVNAIGEKHGVIVEHYIISSGLREMIEATGPAKAGAFKRIYASSFLFDEAGVAIWPAQVVNYTNKTQFLFRISKGVLDPNDPDVNKAFDPCELRVPFTDMVYIGDSATDIPCMKLINSYGGHSIGVYDPDTCDKSKVITMINENRIRYYSPADYSEGSELEQLLEKIIRRTQADHELKQIQSDCVNGQ
jgi:2-hydroxy-3-keto-5-methylthiopentenyl-1-phosphate phosphatase